MAVMALVTHYCAIILVLANYCPFTKVASMYDMPGIQSLVNKLRYEISLV